MALSPQGHESGAGQRPHRPPDTELDILHREEAMARYWRAVAREDYNIAMSPPVKPAGLANAVLPAADVITGMAQQAARTLTAIRAV